MDPLVRGRRLLLTAGGRAILALLLTAAASCAPKVTLHGVGSSTAGGVAGASAPVAPTPSPASPVPHGYRATFTRIGGRRVAAGGHAGGRFDADLYVSPDAKDALFTAGRVIEAGTVLVLDAIPRGAASGGPVFMMEKRGPGYDAKHGDWRYVVVDGTKVDDGPLEVCASCHDEAPHDHVFAVE